MQDLSLQFGHAVLPDAFLFGLEVADYLVGECPDELQLLVAGFGHLFVCCGLVVLQHHHLCVLGDEGFLTHPPALILELLLESLVFFLNSSQSLDFTLEVFDLLIEVSLNFSQFRSLNFAQPQSLHLKLKNFDLFNFIFHLLHAFNFTVLVI